jgi:hypothetical protein
MLHEVIDLSVEKKLSSLRGEPSKYLIDNVVNLWRKVVNLWTKAVNL